jgi:DNA-binding transcriptional regulator LsrR (DeoR family)
MRVTTITIKGEMTKECIADIVHYALKVQKKYMKKGDKGIIMVHVSNNVYSDAEVQQVLRKKFGDNNVTTIGEPDDAVYNSGG